MRVSRVVGNWAHRLGTRSQQLAEGIWQVQHERGAAVLHTLLERFGGFNLKLAQVPHALPTLTSTSGGAEAEHAGHSPLTNARTSIASEGTSAYISYSFQRVVAGLIARPPNHHHVAPSLVDHPMVYTVLHHVFLLTFDHLERGRHVVNSRRPRLSIHKSFEAPNVEDIVLLHVVGDENIGPQ
jgi:hypothetical protein